MNALESPPLEALAFNYLTYGVLTAVNNIWTFVALLTAAVSFWRIKSLSVSSKSDPPRRIRDSSPENFSPPPPPSPPAEYLSLCAAESSDGTTRGKFTVYYNEEDNVRESGSESEGEDFDGRYCYGRDGGWCESWERMKMGEAGWYRYQDLTVLDGNVVRLWDGGKGRNSGISGGAIYNMW
ncbi:hypothetical protein LguiA_036295 [Lonicera macranthoides]